MNSDHTTVHNSRCVYTHLQKCAWKSAAEVALGSIKLSKFKISDGDLSSSSTRPSSSFASDASRPGPAMCDIVPVSPSESSDGAPLQVLPPSSLSSYTCIVGGRAGVAAPATPAPAPGEGGAQQARRVPSAGTILGSCWSGKP